MNNRRVTVLILALAGLAAIIQPTACSAIESWFGPPDRRLREAYQGDEKEQKETKEKNENAEGRKKKPKVVFDHSLLTKVLAAHVDAKGMVNYKALHRDHKDLDAYLALLAKADFKGLGRDGKLALLINAYNACTLKLIVDHYPVKSIYDIPEKKRWDAKRWKVASMVLSLTEIEHEYLRKNFKEPRIHFAINCASISCPPLRREAFVAKNIGAQLQTQTVEVHRRPLWFELDSKAGVVKLTALYNWYGKDFVQVAGSVLTFAARYDQKLASLLKAKKAPKIEWLPYDWDLNAAGR